jgi:hypothetical protein
MAWWRPGGLHAPAAARVRPPPCPNPLRCPPPTRFLPSHCTVLVCVLWYRVGGGSGSGPSASARRRWLGLSIPACTKRPKAARTLPSIAGHSQACVSFAPPVAVCPHGPASRPAPLPTRRARRLEARLVRAVPLPASRHPLAPPLHSVHNYWRVGRAARAPSARALVRCGARRRLHGPNPFPHHLVPWLVDDAPQNQNTLHPRYALPCSRSGGPCRQELSLWSPLPADAPSLFLLLENRLKSKPCLNRPALPLFPSLSRALSAFPPPLSRCGSQASSPACAYARNPAPRACGPLQQQRVASPQQRAPGHARLLWPLP